MIIFEFFSGIGGMHQALHNIAEIKTIYPFDINPNANITYYHNFGIKPFELSLENYSLSEYEKMCLNSFTNSEEFSSKNLIWTMSPPCQPFTRQGKIKDLNDDRTNGFKNLLQILEQINEKFLPHYFFLENVKNFEYSDTWSLLIKILVNRGYKITHFLLSPNQFGIPNSRLRYYLIAKFDKSTNSSNNDIAEIITSSQMFKEYENFDSIPRTIKDFLNTNLQSDCDPSYFLSEKILNKDSTLAIDIVTLNSNTTNCFTKSYGRLLKGSGSILLIDDSIETNTELKLIELKNKIRFFTSEEIMRFMSFNDKFSFQDNFPLKSKYKLLGNSINVKVVQILMKHLLFYFK